MPIETQKSFNTTQNPPEPSELAVDLSVHVNAVLQGMVEEARNRGDLARVIGLDRASRFSDQPVNLEWVFEGDEDTRLVDDDFARSYLESGLDLEGDQHDADAIVEMYAEAESLDPREGYSRAAIQVDQDERGLYHTRVVSITGQGDEQRIAFIEPQSACVRLAVRDLGKKWIGEDFLYGGSVTGYLEDDFRDDDGRPKAATVQDAQGVHYDGVDPEQYLNFALNGGFLNEFPVEIPPDLLC
ncbi:hypothetical protein H6800_02225 [Candidatus Nomurabacteria bacterium]|nr:hypothetical protein [Candidatus Nomurabacteria bacterium]